MNTPEGIITISKWGASLALSGLALVQFGEVPSELISAGPLAVLAGVIFMLLQAHTAAIRENSKAQESALKELHKEVETLRRIIEAKK